jgi:hypothetical protein
MVEIYNYFVAKTKEPLILCYINFRELIEKTG